MFIKNFKNKKAESLVELTIAVSILSLVLISMMNVLSNAKVSSEWSEKRVQATSLAREWLEMFRYIRELNYMKHSDKKRICWNFLADNQKWWTEDWKINWDDDFCSENWASSANYIFKDNNYYIPLQNLSDQSNWRYFLHWDSITSSAWDLKKNNWETFSDSLWLWDFLLCKYSPKWLISSCKSPPSLASNPSDFKKMKFIRWIKIEYVNVFWELCSTNPLKDPCSTTLWDEKTLNHIKATSTVLWLSWTAVSSVDLVTIFSDSRDRKSRND